MRPLFLFPTRKFPLFYRRSRLFPGLRHCPVTSITEKLQYIDISSWITSYLIRILTKIRLICQNHEAIPAFYDIFLPDMTSFNFSLHKCFPASSRISSGVISLTAFKHLQSVYRQNPKPETNIHASASENADS